VPGLRSTVTVFAPPWTVDIAPSTGPLEPCWIVRFCGTGDKFVSVIVTFPALAVSQLCENVSRPPGSATAKSELLPASDVKVSWMDGAAAGVLEEL